MDERRDKETMTEKTLTEETMTTEEKRTAEDIRGNIHQTISEMGRTLDEIRYRLSPEELAAQAKGRLQRATSETVSKFKEQMGESMDEYQGAFKETLREHPVPIALAGIGLGWFLMAMIKEQSDRRRGLHYPEECHYYYSRETGTMEQICPAGQEGAWGETGGHLDTGTGGMKGKVAQKGEEWKEGMAQKGEEWRGQMSHSAEQAKARASRYTREARGKFRQTRSELSYQLRENPLSLGMLALAAGAVIGLIIPESRWEDRMMGEKREELLHRAREKGAEQVQKARHAVEETVEKSKETFMEELKKEEEPAI
jgi:hypothetical protein